MSTIQFLIILFMFMIISAELGFLIFRSKPNSTNKPQRHETGVRLMDSRHENAIEMEKEE